jgi:hypothetical protein
MVDGAGPELGQRDQLQQLVVRLTMSTTRSSATKLRLAVMVALWSVIGGCAVDAQPPPALLTDAATDLAARAGSYRADQHLLFRAERELTRRCMATQGQHYPADDTPDLTDDEFRPNLEARRRHGYTQPGGPPAEEHLRNLSPAERDTYERALVGEPGSARATLRLSTGQRFSFATKGCIAQSRIELYGGVMEAATVAYVPQAAYNQLYDRVATDAAMGQAMRRWAECMSSNGYAYPDMGAARQAVAAQAVVLPSSALDLEVRVATADANCVVAVGIPQLAEQLGRRFAQTLPAEQRHELNQAAELRTAALRRATAFVPATGVAAQARSPDWTDGT